MIRRRRTTHPSSRVPPLGRTRASFLALGLVLLVGCQANRGSLDVVEAGYVPAGAVAAEDLMVVDCLLPGTVRKLGRGQVFMTPRRPIKTSGSECEIRGGEYTAYDRADYRTALRVWLDAAKQGDARAQTNVGEIYEKGLGVEPDYAVAADWYRKAADQGFERAMLNLGQLHELGRGVKKDMGEAIALYRKASGLKNVALEIPPPPAPRKTKKKKSKPDPMLLAALAPPSIQLIEPSIPATRALQVVYNPPAAAPNTTRTLIGRVDAPAGLMALVIDDVERKIDSDGLFRAELKVPTSEREIVIAAVDQAGRRTERRIKMGVERAAAPRARVVGKTAKRSGATFGRYHALVIGNGDYKHLPKLQTARADADAVAELLRDRYGFAVTLIRDATRYDILSALNKMRATLSDEDNLLVYYAGHGELDEVNMRGQWLPVDAERESTANWISNVAITDVLNAMNARHVMVVSDSCYSGALTRSSLSNLNSALSDEQRSAWLRTLASKRSRTALTSGGLAPVLDAGGGGHSVFAGAFLEVLGENDDVLEGQRLFQELSARVTFAARNYQFEQMPQYAPIKFAGHEAGDFFLVPVN